MSTTNPSPFWSPLSLGFFVDVRFGMDFDIGRTFLAIDVDEMTGVVDNTDTDTNTDRCIAEREIETRKPYQDWLDLNVRISSSSFLFVSPSHPSIHPFIHSLTLLYFTSFALALALTVTVMLDVRTLRNGSMCDAHAQAPDNPSFRFYPAPDIYKKKEKEGDGDEEVGVGKEKQKEGGSE